MAKTKELVKFKHVKSLGDCTSIYSCELLTTFTVQEFVQSVLLNKDEWGTIYIGENILSRIKLEYRLGEIVNDKHGIAGMNDKVKEISANGGWSSMDYIVRI